MPGIFLEAGAARGHHQAGATESQFPPACVGPRLSPQESLLSWHCQPSALGLGWAQEHGDAEVGLNP